MSKLYGKYFKMPEQKKDIEHDKDVQYVNRIVNNNRYNKKSVPLMVNSSVTGGGIQRLLYNKETYIPYDHSSHQN
jgi:hypothetical protein